jgi:hypothetical protein
MSTNDNPQPWPPLPMLWERIRIEPTGCWTWTGARTGPKVAPIPSITYQGRRIRATRWAWFVVRGKPGPLLRRLCDNQMCVNPDCHVEHGKQLFCVNGHRMTPDNTYVNPRSGKRKCVTCRRLIQATDHYKQIQLRREARYFAERPEWRARVQRNKANYRQRQAIAKLIDRDHAYWSPSAQRWMVNEGHRWIKGVEQEVWAIAKRVLAEHNQLPQGEKAAIAKLHDTLGRLKRLHPNLEEDAA